jgi:hypothetical protein
MGLRLGRMGKALALGILLTNLTWVFIFCFFGILEAGFSVKVGGF